MTEFYLILFASIIGVGYTSYKIGHFEGSAKMLEMLEHIGIIYYDKDDNVMPNSSYRPKNRVKK